MAAAIATLLNQLKDPQKEVNLIRRGLKASIFEAFLSHQGYAIKDVLVRLDIPASSYFAKKKEHKPLDANTTEKFVRLVQVIIKASRVIGRDEAKNWLYRPVPSLGNELPINLLDTEPGHRMVEQVLLQIEHGIYG